MGFIRIDPLGDLAEQSHAVLVATVAAGHGAHTVTWDAAQYGYHVPDDVDRPETAAVRKVEAGEEVDDDESEAEVQAETPTRGRRSRKPETE